MSRKRKNKHKEISRFNRMDEVFYWSAGFPAKLIGGRVTSIYQKGLNFEYGVVVYGSKMFVRRDEDVLLSVEEALAERLRGIQELG